MSIFNITYGGCTYNIEVNDSNGYVQSCMVQPPGLQRMPYYIRPSEIPEEVLNEIENDIEDEY